MNALVPKDQWSLCVSRVKQANLLDPDDAMLSGCLCAVLIVPLGLVGALGFAWLPLELRWFAWLPLGSLVLFAAGYVGLAQLIGPGARRRSQSSLEALQRALEGRWSVEELKALAEDGLSLPDALQRLELNRQPFYQALDAIRAQSLESYEAQPAWLHDGTSEHELSQSRSIFQPLASLQHTLVLSINHQCWCLLSFDEEALQLRLVEHAFSGPCRPTQIREIPVAKRAELHSLARQTAAEVSQARMLDLDEPLAPARLCIAIDALDAQGNHQKQTSGRVPLESKRAFGRDHDAGALALIDAEQEGGEISLSNDARAQVDPKPALARAQSAPHRRVVLERRLCAWRWPAEDTPAADRLAAQVLWLISAHLDAPLEGQPLGRLPPVIRGRPLRIGGAPQLIAPIMTSKPTGEERAESEALCRRWLEAAQAEHASIASFIQTRLALKRYGAPAELIERCQRAEREEREHAQAAFALASRFGGARYSPGPLPEHIPIPDLATFALETFVDGCVGETIASVEASVAVDRCKDTQALKALQHIAREEAEHAALSWDILTWLYPKLTASTRRRIQGFRATRCAAGEGDPEQGWLTEPQLREVIAEAWAQIDRRRADLDRATSPRGAARSYEQSHTRR